MEMNHYLTIFVKPVITQADDVLNYNALHFRYVFLLGYFSD